MKKNATLLALVILIAGAGWAGQAVNESYPVAPDAEIDVESLSGSLVFEGWDRDVLEISGTLGDGVESLEVDSDEDGISIEVEYDEHYHGKQIEHTNLTIHLPRSVSLSVETVSASISAAGLSGDLELESVSGRIEVAGTPTSLDAESVSGSVRVDSAPPGSDLSSVSGDVVIRNAQGGIDAESVSGSIMIEDGILDGGDFETVSGNITCKAELSGNEDLDMETMSGTLTLFVDSGMAARYEISTFSGAIKNEIGPEAKRTSKYTPGSELNFNTGPNGPRISISSFSGTVKLLTR